MMRTMAGFLPGFLLCGSIIIWGSRPVQAAAYQYTTISNSSHPNDGVYAEGLNDGGVVVGMDTTQKIGFVWANGIGKAINGAVYFNAINDNNIAAGALYGTDNAGIVVTYNVANGSIQNYQLPIPVDVISRLFINAGGEIAGTSYAKDFKKNYTAFVIQPDGEFLTLAFPNETQCSVIGMSDGGAVVGACRQRPFLYNNGKLKSFKVPGADHVTITSITSSGVIGGSAYVGSTQYAFIYDSGKYTTFIPNIPNFKYLYNVIGLLPNGEIIGNYYTSNYIVHGFVYNRAKEKAYQLDAPNSGITEYTAVSAYGDLIGEVVGTQFIATCPSGETCVK